MYSITQDMFIMQYFRGYYGVLWVEPQRPGQKEKDIEVKKRMGRAV